MTNLLREIPNVDAMILSKLDELIDKLEKSNASRVDQNGMNTEEYLIVSKTAEFLNCSEPHVYTLKTKIPHILRGARLYFKKSDLIDYMEKGRVVPDRRMASHRR